MAELLKIPTEGIEERARLHLTLPPSVLAETPRLDKGTLGVVLGGREAYRTYEYWPDFLSLLWQAYPEQPVVLLGADNGFAMSQRIEETFPNAPLVHAVAKFPLLTSAALIQQCKMLVLADGGLLHIANALSVPTLSLFAQVPPRYRYTRADRFVALETAQNVNEISPEKIFTALKDFS